MDRVEGSGAKLGQLREAYLPNRRVRLASDVAGLSAVGLLLGVLGSGLTWWGRSDLFDLAGSAGDAVKINLGFLAGPLLILIALPLVIGRARQLALKRLYRTRLVVAAALWGAGLAILVARLEGLDGYALEAGAYVAGALLVVGLLATLAMWPGSLRVVMVDRNGRVRETLTPAGARTARSRRGR